MPGVSAPFNLEQDVSSFLGSQGRSAPFPRSHPQGPPQWEQQLHQQLPHHPHSPSLDAGPVAPFLQVCTICSCILGYNCELASPEGS